jgi:hypothetical protein
VAKTKPQNLSRFGDPNHWDLSCPNHFDKRQHGNTGNTTDVFIGDTDMKDAMNIYPTILSVCHSS